MANNSISQFYGDVQQCNACSNAKGEPMSCHSCFSRGYLARCTACNGTGQTEAPVAGAGSGKMKSTCAPCGGKGFFGVPKPADWKDPVPVEAEKTLATA